MPTMLTMLTMRYLKPHLRHQLLWGALLAGLALGGCASAEKRPVLYPNSHLEKVGNAQAQQDIDACMRRAEDSGISPTGDNKVLEQGAKGAAVGGAAAAAGTAVRGGPVLRNASAGAAAGAAGGAVHGAFKGNVTNPTFKNFVSRCLRDSGYSVIGWQ